METIQNLITTIDSIGLESQTKEYIQNKFLPFLQQAQEWKEKASALIVTHESQVNEMKMARISRLALKEIRVKADKTRVELKEDSIKYGKAVQSIYNLIASQIEPIEKHLQEQEDFVKIKEQKRKEELKVIRLNELQPFIDFVPYGLSLGELTEEDYQKTLYGAKLQYEAKIESDKKAEEERLLKEQQEKEERERIRLENEKLKEEAKKKEEEALKLKKELDAKLENERKQNKLLQEKLEQEKIRIAKELKEKQAAENKAKRAPDKQKLIDLANYIEQLNMPELKSDEGKKIIDDVHLLLKKVSNYIIEKSSQF